MPRTKRDQNWQMIERLILKLLSERCGKRMVDLSLTDRLGPNASSVVDACSKLLKIGRPDGITDQTTIIKAVDLMLKHYEEMQVYIREAAERRTEDEKRHPSRRSSENFYFGGRSLERW